MTLTLDRELQDADASILASDLTGAFSNSGIRADVEVDGSIVRIVAEQISEADATRTLEASSADLRVPFAITIIDSTSTSRRGSADLPLCSGSVGVPVNTGGVS